MADIYEGRPRADSSDVASRKIFIGGLSYSTDEEKLKRYFRDYGIVQDAVVMKDPVTKRSRGFGFITFFDPLSVDAVLAAEPHVIDGRKVEAKRAVPRSEMNALGVPAMSTTPTMNGKVGTPMSSAASEQSKSMMHGSSTPQQSAIDENAYNKIFVGGLHYDTRDQEFRDHFSRFGKVVYGEVMFNRETHKSRGFGFIVFENAESALRACDVREHILDGKVVEVKLAIPRSKIGSSTPGTPSGNGMMNMGMMTPSSSTPGSVRGRTLSMGSGLSPSVPLSGNSSTLAAAHGSHKIGPGILSGNTPSGMPLRKPASISGLAQLAGSNSRNMTPSAAHYPTTLRIGPNGAGGMDELLEDDPLAGAYIEDFVIENARPSRALSEPIVRYEGGTTPTSHSFLHNDMLNFSTFLHPPSNTPQYSSQTASRSSSIALPQGRSSFTMGSMSTRSPEPMFGVAEATNRVGSMSLAEKLFNNGSGSGNSLSGLLFPSAHDGGSESTMSPNPTGDMLFSSPTRDVYGNVEQVSGGGASRRTSLTGASGDIWGNNNNLSAQTTSESLWSTGYGDSAVNNGGNGNGGSNNGLLATINAQSLSYSRSVSKDENPTLTSLLQQTGGWPSSNEGMDMSGLPPPQRRHSSGGMGGDGIAASHSLIAELRMNSHEYDLSSNPKNHPVNSLGATWGNSGLGY